MNTFPFSALHLFTLFLRAVKWGRSDGFYSVVACKCDLGTCRSLVTITVGVQDPFCSFSFSVYN